ncbi:hypothetical protein DFJ73DRAFT_957374 [Zopfochytrium polystomum]|nr:hypothetical protein DFJ73DRAFT_957374 [Zopfochytrium polystomum]
MDNTSAAVGLVATAPTITEPATVVPLLFGTNYVPPPSLTRLKPADEPSSSVASDAADLVLVLPPPLSLAADAPSETVLSRRRLLLAVSPWTGAGATHISSSPSPPFRSDGSDREPQSSQIIVGSNYVVDVARPRKTAKFFIGFSFGDWPRFKSDLLVCSASLEVLQYGLHAIEHNDDGPSTLRLAAQLPVLQHPAIGGAWCGDALVVVQDRGDAAPSATLWTAPSRGDRSATDARLVWTARLPLAPNPVDVPTALNTTLAAFCLPDPAAPRLVVVRAADGSTLSDTPLPLAGPVRSLALTAANHLLVLHGPDADPLVSAYDLDAAAANNPRLLGSRALRALLPASAAARASHTFHASDDGRVVAVCASDRTALETPPPPRADGTPRAGRLKRSFIRTEADLVVFENVGGVLTVSAVTHEWISHVNDDGFDGFVVAAGEEGGAAVVGFVRQPFK